MWGGRRRQKLTKTQTWNASGASDMHSHSRRADPAACVGRANSASQPSRPGMLANAMQTFRSRFPRPRTTTRQRSLSENHSPAAEGRAHLVLQEAAARRAFDERSKDAYAAKQRMQQEVLRVATELSERRASLLNLQQEIQCVKIELKNSTANYLHSVAAIKFARAVEQLQTDQCDNKGRKGSGEGSSDTMACSDLIQFYRTSAEEFSVTKENLIQKVQQLDISVDQVKTDISLLEEMQHTLEAYTDHSTSCQPISVLKQRYPEEPAWRRMCTLLSVRARLVDQRRAALLQLQSLVEQKASQPSPVTAVDIQSGGAARGHI